MEAVSECCIKKKQMRLDNVSSGLYRKNSPNQVLTHIARAARAKGPGQGNRKNEKTFMDVYIKPQSVTKS